MVQIVFRGCGGAGWNRIGAAQTKTSRDLSLDIWTTAVLALVGEPSPSFLQCSLLLRLPPLSGLNSLQKSQGEFSMPLRTIAEIVAILIIVVLAIRFFKSRA